MRAPAGRGGREDGVALVATLLVLALLVAVTAATLLVTRSELWVAGSARSYLQARYSAEAGVWHALSLLAPGRDFDALLGGGGLVDATSPGPILAAGGAEVFFPGPPFGYAVAVRDDGGGATDGNERVLLLSSATAVRGARRTVVATVGRAETPYAPAALVVTSGRVTVAPALDGVAPEAGGIGLDARNPADGLQAIVGAAPDGAAETARATLAGHGARLLGAVASAGVRAFDVVELALASGLAEQSPGVLAADQGAAGAPVALLVAPGAAPRLVGAGVLLARGNLDLQGPVDWRGVVIVGGVLRISGPSCRLAGMAWAAEVSFATGCDLRFDLPAILEADLAERLPRRATLLAMDDA